MRLQGRYVLGELRRVDHCMSDPGLEELAIDGRGVFAVGAAAETMLEVSAGSGLGVRSASSERMQLTEGVVHLGYKAGDFVLSYERVENTTAPKVETMLGVLAPSGSGLSSVELPISGGVEWLKRVQLDKLKLTLEGLQVTHASVSVKLKGKEATQQAPSKNKIQETRYYY